MEFEELDSEMDDTWGLRVFWLEIPILMEEALSDLCNPPAPGQLVDIP